MPNRPSPLPFSSNDTNPEPWGGGATADTNQKWGFHNLYGPPTHTINYPNPGDAGLCNEGPRTLSLSASVFVRIFAVKSLALSE